MTDKPYIAVWLDEKATKEEEPAVKEALERETGMRFRRRDEMTPQEKAEQLLNQSPLTRQWGDDAKRVFTAAFADIIIAAVEEEREACRQIAVMAARPFDPFSDPRAAIAIQIAEAIAARTDGGTK